mmetsp:Transcript_1709/g.2533  ORF Transcript_1709/g.2533 Transcript_1709/m.2533 type:complete len:420 (+) Transcript_1709:81-1340(+)
MLSVLINTPKRALLFRSLKKSGPALPRVTTDFNKAFYSVWTWGYGNDGQLGHMPFTPGNMAAPYTELIPRQLESDMGDEVVYTSCGLSHTAMVTADGALWTWGSCRYGALGQGEAGKQAPAPAPRRVEEGLEGVRVVAVACGDHHTVALDDNGNCYSTGWGGSFVSGCGGLGLGTAADRDRFEPLASLAAEGVSVAALGAGSHHTAFLTRDHEVYVCGESEYGRLGTGSLGDALIPEPLDIFEDLGVAEIRRLSVGQAFTLAACADGRVYGWGRNDQGQLGLGGGLQMDVYNMEEVPTLVEALEGERVVEVACGKHHAAAVTDGGQLYMWGMKRVLEPQLMTELSDIHVKKAYCGDNFTYALSDKGHLYSFGKGGSRSLGHGDKKTYPQPTLVEAMKDKKVISMSCGHRHVAALVDDGA